MSENVKRTFSAILKVLLIILGILLFTKMELILPFLIAYFFASLIEPVVKFCSNKLKIPRKIGTVISMLIVLGIILSILGFLVSRLVIEIKDVYNDIEINAESLTQFLILLKQQAIFIKLPVPLMEIIDQSVDAITGALQGVLKSV